MQESGTCWRVNLQEGGIVSCSEHHFRNTYPFFRPRNRSRMPGSSPISAHLPENRSARHSGGDSPAVMMEPRVDARFGRMTMLV